MGKKILVPCLDVIMIVFVLHRVRSHCNCGILSLCIKKRIKYRGSEKNTAITAVCTM